MKQRQNGDLSVKFGRILLEALQMIDSITPRLYGDSQILNVSYVLLVRLTVVSYHHSIRELKVII